MAINAGNTSLPSNADSAYAIKDGVKKSLDEIQCIYQGKTLSVWKKQKYYFVTFNSNGGTGNMNQQTMPVGVATALTANAFSKLGYLFANWAKSASGSAAYTDKQSVKDIAAAGETITLYALWTAITWYVVYNANGGSGSMANSEHKYDTAKALTANAFSKTGYLFAGWDTDDSDAAVNYSDKASVKNLASTHGAKVNLYAVWTAITWYVKYNGNGATSGSMADSEHKYDTAKALTANAFSKTGYLFAGWDTDDSDAAVNYSDKASVKNLASTHGAKVNLYAVWTAITWYVKYNGNGATSGSMADSEHKYDTAKALTANAFARSGYNFSGWATSSAGAKAYDDKQSVKNLKSIHGAVLNLYATWKMTEILTAGTWKSSATSVNNGVMSYNSEGYLAATISVKDGTATFAGPSFNIDVTDLSTISFTVYLWGYDSTDASGGCNVTFTIGGKSINFHHSANDAATTQTLSIDVSSMSGVQKCTCTMVEDCRQEEDEWGWSSNHTVRLLNITPT